LLGIFEIGSLILPELASNCNPPNLCLARITGMSFWHLPSFSLK
jgi:hypothetical protein